MYVHVHYHCSGLFDVVVYCRHVCEYVQTYMVVDCLMLLLFIFMNMFNHMVSYRLDELL